MPRAPRRSGTGSVIKWTFGDTQNNLYVLKSFSPRDANVGPIGALDPAVNLVIGDRYTAIITSFPHHPLELIAGGATPFDDIVLLAQTNKDEPLNQTAEWESDPAVDWVTDPEQKSVSFTVTPALAAALFDPTLGLTPQYRCGNPFHRGFQRGALLFSSGAPAPKDAPHDGFGKTFVDASSLGPDASGSANVSGTLEASDGVDVFRYVAPITGIDHGDPVCRSRQLAQQSFAHLQFIATSHRRRRERGCRRGRNGTDPGGRRQHVLHPVVRVPGKHRRISAFGGIPGRDVGTLGRPSINLDAVGSAKRDREHHDLGGQNVEMTTATAAGPDDDHPDRSARKLDRPAAAGL